MDLGLRDKIALVTGAGSGIGQAIALSLAGEGARLVATDVRQETAAATAATAMACGVEALGVPLDVTSYEQTQAVVQQAVQRFGRVDILVNCAGAWRVNPLRRSRSGRRPTPRRTSSARQYRSR